MIRLLTLDNSWTPVRWTDYQEGIVLKYKGLLAHEIGEQLSPYRGGINRISGKKSIISVAPIIILKQKVKFDNTTPPLTNSNLFKRDRHICCYCGRIYREEKLSRDHIIPVSKNGPNTWMNVVTSCKTCNRVKADRTPEEAEMPLLYVPYKPTHIERLLLQNRNVLADQHEFLASMLPEHSRLRYV